MIRTALLAAALATATAASASAAGSVAYLARAGGGTTCTQTSPCNSMTQAATAAGPNGEVVCLDAGNYGGGSLAFALTISCGDGLWQVAGSLLSITIPAGGDVAIEGLVMDTLGLSTTASFSVFGQGTLHLHRARIGNNAGSPGHGLSFAPTGGATLHVSDSVFYNNAGSGIHVRPTGSGFANVHLRNVKYERNGNGLFIDGSASTIGINVDVAGSIFAENSGNGIGALFARRRRGHHRGGEGFSDRRQCREWVGRARVGGVRCRQCNDRGR